MRGGGAQALAPRVGVGQELNQLHGATINRSSGRARILPSACSAPTVNLSGSPFAQLGDQIGVAIIRPRCDRAVQIQRHPPVPQPS